MVQVLDLVNHQYIRHKNLISVLYLIYTRNEQFGSWCEEQPEVSTDSRTASSTGSCAGLGLLWLFRAGVPQLIWCTKPIHIQGLFCSAVFFV